MDTGKPPEPMQLILNAGLRIGHHGYYLQFQLTHEKQYPDTVAGPETTSTSQNYALPITVYNICGAFHWLGLAEPQEFTHAVNGVRTSLLKNQSRRKH